MTHPLTKYRQDRAVSAEELARLAGTSRQTIHRIETGAQTPSLDMVARIREATNGAVTADDFLPARDPAPAESAA